MYNDINDIGSVMLDIKNICQKNKIFHSFEVESNN